MRFGREPQNRAEAGDFSGPVRPISWIHNEMLAEAEQLSAILSLVRSGLGVALVPARVACPSSEHSAQLAA